MGVSQSFAGIVVARFFLGVTESGLFPGVVFYLSMWYKRTEVLYRVALFFSAASLAGAFGGILAYGIGFMKGVGGYSGWRWIFIIVRLSPSPFQPQLLTSRSGRTPHSSDLPPLLPLHPQLPLNRSLPHGTRTLLHPRPPQTLLRRNSRRALFLGRRHLRSQRLQMLALRTRIPHHVSTTVHTLPLPPHHHQNTRLLGRKRTTTYRPTLRRCHDPDRHRRSPIRENTPTFSIHPSIHFPRYNRVYPPPLRTSLQTWPQLRRNNSSSSRHLSIYSNRTLLGRGERIRTNEKSNSYSYDDHYWEFGRGVGNAAL